ncbi:MAG: uracil-DNA glycosylase family protein [Halioglobus sp.]
MSRTHRNSEIALTQLLDEVRACRHCAASLPLGPKPVLRAGAGARLMIVGQAPGTRVHASGVPWDDPSGERLRDWLNSLPDVFYDASRVAIMPMGFCYRARANPAICPRRRNAHRGMHQLLAHLPALELTLLVGSYAQAYYLESPRGAHRPRAAVS